MKRIFAFTMIAVMSLAMFVGCSGDNKEEEKVNNASVQKTSSTSELSGKVSVVGSTSVAPVAQELAEAFEKKRAKS